MNTKRKLAVIGAGLIGRRHIALVAENGLCDLVAVCDPAPEVAETAAAYNTSYYQDVETMLDAEQIEGVVVATPTNLHTPIGIQCAERGVHLLVEKPIAGTVADGVALVEAAEQHNVHLLVGHHRRHNPLVQTARDIVQSGTIGALVGVTAMFTLLKPDDYFDVEWRTRPGAGPVLTNLIHDIDNLRFICGDIKTVYAVSSSATRGFAVEDTASVTLTFANGALGSVLVSDATPSPWSYEFTAGENPVYPYTGQDCYRFCGTAGSLGFPSMTLWRYPEGKRAGWFQPLGQNRLIAPPSVSPLSAQITHFCRVMAGEVRPLITGVEGLKTLAVTQAVFESARSRAPVTVKRSL